MTPADFLLLDIGNSTTKLRLASRTRLLGQTRRIATPCLTEVNGAQALQNALAGWQYRRVIFACVVPAALRGVYPALKTVETVRVGAQRKTHVDLGGYPGRKTLGDDRVANMVGALALYGPGPLIVVDFGTAATFNALDERGRFLGGVIAPGLHTLANSLPARTAQLPAVRLTGTFPRAVGRNTREALRAGALLGFRGLVREIVAALRTELGHVARVVATGGDARAVARWGTPPLDVVDPQLTLQGLRIAGLPWVPSESAPTRRSAIKARKRREDQNPSL